MAEARKAMRALGGIAAALGSLASTASAAPLVFAGTLRVDFGWPPIASFSAAGSGTAAVSNLGAFTLPAGVFVLIDADALAATPQNIAQTLSLSASNEAGAFANGVLRMPLLGFIGHFGRGLAPLYSFALTLLSARPIGTTATAIASFTIFSTTPQTTLTLTTLTIATLSGAGFAVADDDRTAQGLGSLQLVAPFTFNSILAATELPGEAVLTLEFVPEPGALGAGVCAFTALLLLGARYVV